MVGASDDHLRSKKTEPQASDPNSSTRGLLNEDSARATRQFDLTCISCAGFLCTVKRALWYRLTFSRLLCWASR